MTNLDERLRQGPLKVRSLGVSHSVDELSHQILKRRRVAFARNLTLGCAALCVVAFVSLRGLSDTEVATPNTAAPVAPRVASVPVLPARTTFADGSFAQLASSQGSLEVEEETPRRVITRLRGAARFDVKEHKKRAFEVHSGEVRVRVLGSAFSVEQLPGGKARVQVERGPVEVAWLGGGARLESGESGAFPPEDRTGDKQAEKPSESTEVAAAMPAASEDSPVSTRRKRGKHGKKPALSLPAPEPVSGSEDAATLMATADAERLHGDPEQALRPLRAIFERYPNDPRAPLAAFAMGRVLLDDLHRPAEAAAAFARVRALSPEGALVPDALAREASAWAAAGQIARAQKLAEQYLALHPRGRHASAMQKTLTR